MDLFEFDFNDMMATDIICVGPVKRGDQLGDALIQAVILSRYGYEVKLVSEDNEQDDIADILKEHGITKIDWPEENEMEDLVKGIRILSICQCDSFEVEEKKKAIILVQKAKEAGAIVCLDSGKEIMNPILLSNTDYIFPNQEEAEYMTNQEILPQMALSLMESGVKNVVITLGKDGCFVRNQSVLFAMGAIPTEIIDKEGVGANFAAGFLYALMEEWELKSCCEYGIGCATVSLRLPGAISKAKERKDSVKKVYL